MAWIESHQTVWAHAKTRKAARRLGISNVQLVGHLHALWHWAIDHAEDGNVSKYDDEDLAIAGMWEGDARDFVGALVDCGPGDSAGYLERGGCYGPPENERSGDLVLHDWWGYAGKLIARRQRDRDRAAARRSEEAPTTVARPSRDAPQDAASRATQPDPTEPTQPTNASGESDADDSEEPRIDEATQQFEQHFWPTYPARNGKKKHKGKALVEWRKLSVGARRRALIGARNLAASGELPPDAFRFLRKDTAGEYPFDDWQAPAVQESDGVRMPSGERLAW